MPLFVTAKAMANGYYPFHRSLCYSLKEKRYMCAKVERYIRNTVE